MELIKHPSQAPNCRQTCHATTAARHMDHVIHISYPVVFVASFNLRSQKGECLPQEVYFQCSNRYGSLCVCRAVDKAPIVLSCGCTPRTAVVLLCVMQEYIRAAHVLSGLSTPVALFLRCYALFLAGEKQKE